MISILCGRALLVTLPFLGIAILPAAAEDLTIKETRYVSRG